MEKLKLAILGVGLIGGSFGLAVKDKLGDDIYITGTTHTEKSARLAKKAGAVDKCGLDNIEAVKDADVIYLSTPVLQIIPIIKEILPHLKKHAIITDAASTKQYLAEAIRKILPDDIYYVSAHPMAGREKSGVAAATKDLFKNKCYVIIKDKNLPEPKAAVQKIHNLIALTGANVMDLELEKHDRCAALISHVPHITAAALVALVKANDEAMDDCVKLAGGGFKDTTRIASSNADMWADICISNATEIASDLHTLQSILDDVITAIESKNREKLHAYFTAAKKTREYILEETQDIYEIE